MRSVQAPKPGEDYNAQLRKRVETQIQGSLKTLQKAEAELAGLGVVLECPHDWEETWTRVYDIHRSTNHLSWTCRICKHRAV